MYLKLSLILSFSQRYFYEKRKFTFTTTVENLC